MTPPVDRPGSGTGRRPQGLMRKTGGTTAAAALAMGSGLVLDLAIVVQFGAGRLTDSFVVASRIPLAVLAVLMVGANQALVPFLTTSVVRRGERETVRTVTGLIVTSLVGGGAVALLAGVLAEPLVRLTAPGLSGSDVDLTVTMARVMFAVVPISAATEAFRGYLNARHSPVVPAGMNLFLNATAAITVVALAGDDIRIVPFGFLAGAVIRFVIVGAVAAVHGYRPTPNLGFTDPEVRAALALCVRPLAGAGLIPLARLVEQALVSLLPPGSITILNYGYRLVSGTGGTVFFRSIVVVMVPRLTEAQAQGDAAAVRRITGQLFRMMLTVSAVMTAFLVVLAQPVVRVVFAWGEFERADARLLGVVLALLSVNLVADALQRASLSPFFARLDTRVPLRNALWGVLVNLALLPAFVLPFQDSRNGVLGAVAAYSMAQYFQFLHARRALRGVDGEPRKLIRSFALKLSLPVLAALAVMASGYVLADLGGTPGRNALALRTLLVGAAGALTLTGVAWAGTPELIRTMRSSMTFGTAGTSGTVSTGEAEAPPAGRRPPERIP